MSKLVVTIEIEMRQMSEGEYLGDGGTTEEIEEDGVPLPTDYEPREIAGLIPGILMLDEVAAEMLAGSAIYVKIEDIAVRGATWEPTQ